MRVWELEGKKQEKALNVLSKGEHPLAVSIKIVSFTLVSYGGKIIEDSNTHIGKSHIIP